MFFRFLYRFFCFVFSYRLSLEWGMNKFDDNSSNCRGFVGEYMCSPVTNKSVLSYSV